VEVLLIDIFSSRFLGLSVWEDPVWRNIVVALVVFWLWILGISSLGGTQVVDVADCLLSPEVKVG
jgi:hypothetical protein